MRYFIIIVILTFSTPSEACFCFNSSFPLTYLEQNDTLPTSKQRFIIKGIVVDNQIGRNVFNRWGHGNLVNIKVLEYWPKDAVINDTVTIINDKLGCAVGFLQDSTYLIGAWNSNRYLGTALFSKYAHSHLYEKLGESGIPRVNLHNEPISQVPAEPSRSINIISIIVFCLSLFLNVVLIMRRK